MILNDAWKILKESPEKTFEVKNKAYTLVVDNGKIVFKDKEGIAISDVSVIIELINRNWEESGAYDSFYDALADYVEGKSGFYFKNSMGLRCSQSPHYPLGNYLEGYYGLTAEDIRTGKFYPLPMEKIPEIYLPPKENSGLLGKCNPLAYLEATRHMHDISYPGIRWE